MPIVSLEFTDLGPFRKARFEFDPQVNVFVGPNNCGKSTALFAIAELVCKKFHLPRKLLRGQRSEFSARITWDSYQLDLKGEFPLTAESQKDRIEKWRLARKQLGFTKFVPALRYSADYRSPGPRQRETDLGPGERRVWRSYQEAVMHEQVPMEARDDDPWLARGDEIVRDIIDLDYRSYREKKPAIHTLLEQIADVVSEITEGFEVKFAGIGEDKRGLFPRFQTPDGQIPFDVLSQGTQSLIQWIARIFIGCARFHEYPDSFANQPAIVVVDEIDAHLQPSWQRRIVPALTKALPNLQLFCSTHSPLMLAGLKAGQIQLLRRNARGVITISRNESDIEGWSADEIIASFLGVDAATDLGTAEKLKRLEELRARARPTPKVRGEIEQLRSSLRGRLLSGPAAEEVERLAEELGRTPGVVRRQSSRKGAPQIARSRRATPRAGKR